MIAVIVNNFTTKPIPESFFLKIAKVVLAGEKIKNGEVSLVIVGDSLMRKLNYQYRKKNRATDVLSFPADSLLFENLKIPELEKSPMLGEIVLCPNFIQKNAKIFQTSFGEELKLCFIHGLLQLLGYEHEKDAQKAVSLQQKEKFYLTKCAKILLPSL